MEKAGEAMSGAGQKQMVVTFKTDTSLIEALKAVPNRSEFIRTAILAALDSQCPLCGGLGVLTPNQKRHWDTFAKHHVLEECDDCHEVRITCCRNRAAGTHRETG
jgi:hypothetical protein